MAETADQAARFVLLPALAGDLTDPSPALARGLAQGFTDPRAAADELRAVVAQFEAEPRPPGWAQFWLLDVAAATVVAIAGFKAPPTDGAVEIAYMTFPACEGRGVATAAIRALLAVAAAGGVARVLAHTLPVRNGSNVALARCGFTLAGEVVDPDDGPVWRWVRAM